MTTIKLFRSYGRYALSALSAIAFGKLSQQPIRKDRPMTTIKLVRSYGRYALSALSAIAFGIMSQ